MVLDQFELSGRTAIVTGAGSGLGRAMALSLADAGCDIFAVGRRLAPLEETGRMVQERGRRCVVRSTDVTDSAAVNAMVADAIERLGHIDVLVNNAGMDANTGIELMELTDEQWRVGIDQNVSSAFYCARAVVPHMLERQSGRIINISSGWGMRGGRNNWTYSIAKAGVIQLTKALAMTYARDGIRASCIAPGLLPHSAPEDVQRAAGERQPIGRIGYAWEIGPLAVFLASPASDYLSGETVLLDGGAMAGGVIPAGIAPRNASRTGGAKDGE